VNESDRLIVPQGSFELDRHPPADGAPLRAWDAADEYLLQNVAEHAATEGLRVLVVNDAFGALAVAASGDAESVTSWGDSFLAHTALAANLDRNDIDPSLVTVLPSVEQPPEPDLILLKVTKSMALLKDQLCTLAPLMNNGAVLIGAGMTRNIHNSTSEIFEEVVGPTKTSRAQKKARLIFAERDAELDPVTSPWPATHDVELPTGAALTVANHASVFARDRLDAGTRLLLDNLPTGFDGANIVDLGCGSGILGIAAGLANPGAHVSFVDESYMAAASAEITAEAALAPGSWNSIVGDGLGAAIAAGNIADVDLIVNNPPFHQDHAVGDAVAWQMFNESHAALRPGGELWVVGNRHLGYHAKLNRIFGNNETVASNKKFVVLRSTR